MPASPFPASGPTPPIRSTAKEGGTAGYALTSGIVVAVSIWCIPLSSVIGYRTVSLVLLVVVAALPLAYDRGPVFLASAIAAVSWNFFFIPPVYTFTIGGVDDAMYWGGFVVVAAISGSLGGRLRVREKHAKVLYALTKDLSAAHSQDEVLKASVSHIREFFNSEVVVCLGEPDGDIMPKAHAAGTWFPRDQEMRVAAWAYWNERKGGRGTAYHPTAEALYVPITGPRYALGVIGLRPVGLSARKLSHLEMLDTFVSQIGLACERELLNDLNKQNIIIAESERLYRTVFNSISHELRTPLSAILGAAENLLQKAPDYSRHLVNTYAVEIHTAAERLDKLLKNLLDMSRLESGALRPKADWTDCRDVIASAIQDLAFESQTRTLLVDVPQDLPLIKADFGLLRQALVNVIHNALIHTPHDSRITVSATVKDSNLLISIADEGPGIADNERWKIFEKFFRSPGATASGTGLGLPIAKGFIEAQEGSITANNRKTGGAEFVISFRLHDLAAAG